MSAEEEHVAETLETLKFAGRCSQVETKAQKNIVSGALVTGAGDKDYTDVCFSCNPLRRR